MGRYLENCDLGDHGEHGERHVNTDDAVMNRAFEDVLREDEICSDDEVSAMYWIHSVGADLFFGAWIVLNAMVMAFEVDLRPEKSASDPIVDVWFLLDSLFNTVFLIEIGLRVYAERRAWFSDCWNLFDAVLVLIGVCDTYLLPLVGVEASMRFVTMMRMFRMVKLLRLMRIFRLVRFLKELRFLIAGLISAINATLWGLLLLAITVFVCALLMARLVGKECCDSDDMFNSDPQVYQEYFGTFFRSAFTLFQFTMEFQPDIVRSTWGDGILVTLFLIIYTMFTNIMILNMIASVIVDSILSISRSESESAEAEVKEREMRIQVKKLLDVFKAVDTDHDGTIDRDELELCSKGTGRADPIDLEGAHNISPSESSIAPLRKRFSIGSSVSSDSKFKRSNSKSSIDGLRKAFSDMGITPMQALELFEVLDADGEGHVSKEEFVYGILRMKAAPESKHIMGIEKDIQNASKKVDSVMQIVQGQQERMEKIEIQQAEVVDTVKELARSLSFRFDGQQGANGKYLVPLPGTREGTIKVAPTSL